jgi:ABC-type glycerol-3-phosphate transport system substrate-binding protein
MTSKRRWLALFAFLLAFALVPIACGGDDDDDEDGAPAAEDVSGSISIMGIWQAEEQQNFQRVIDGFTEEYPDVTVRYNGVGDDLPTILQTAVEGGNPPDIAAPAQPGFVQGLVERNELKPIGFLQQAIVDNFGQSIADVGTFNDQLYGLLFKGDNKSTVWYNVSVFEDAGVEPAETWPDFLESARTINASGVPAYSIGGADGWTLTDLFENIYLRQAGPELYDQLSRHEIPWTHASVKSALREMAKVVGDTENIVGGRTGALQTDFETSVTNVFSNNPKAAVVGWLDAVPGVVQHPLEPQTGYNVFTFPSIGDSAPSVVGSGNIFVMFTENAATRAFMQYLTTPEAAEIWVERGGFSSPNKNVDTELYPDEILRTTAGAISEAEVFRFDLSDLVPSAFGATTGQGLWKLFQDFVRNPQNVDGIAQQMEQAATAAD